MKRILLILIIFMIPINCNNKNHAKEQRKKEQAIAIGFLLGCKYSSANPLFADSYYPRYVADQTQWKSLILGDSTGDIACNSFPGYKGLDTGCFPVSGNKISDFESQLCVLSDNAPSVIVITTMGGNDLLAQVDDTEIIRRGKSFVDTLNRKYPNAIKIWVRVHPSRVDYANAHRGTTNLAISDYATSQRWKIIDPDSCFQIDSAGRALQSYLLDAIHPNEQTAFCIKNKIKSEYGVEY